MPTFESIKDDRKHRESEISHYFWNIEQLEHAINKLRRDGHPADSPDIRSLEETISRYTRNIQEAHDEFKMPWHDPNKYEERNKALLDPDYKPKPAPMNPAYKLHRLDPSQFLQNQSQYQAQPKLQYQQRPVADQIKSLKNQLNYLDQAINQMEQPQTQDDLDRASVALSAYQQVSQELKDAMKYGQDQSGLKSTNAEDLYKETVPSTGESFKLLKDYFFGPD